MQNIRNARNKQLRTINNVALFSKCNIYVVKVMLMTSLFACGIFYVALHWALLEPVLFSAYFFDNNISFLLFPAPAPLAEDATALIDLMKRRRKKKKKKKAGRPRDLTTLDTDMAATWKTTAVRTGLMRPHRSPRCQHPPPETHRHSTVTVCLACKVDPKVQESTDIQIL